ncbi:MAG: imidazole glycerol phosphate synthase subunit HisF [Firmicutes bacterium]|nr:imidazole glycerol phosphate synthase subunit HisF [Bacillota bacterium]
MAVLLWKKLLERSQAISKGGKDLAKRIIPCLDVKEGRVVKGMEFADLKDVGDPVELASFYDKAGADELVFLDITASYEKRETVIELVRRTARQLSIPLTVGGGISDLNQIGNLLKAGADKVSLGTSAVKNPSLVNEAASTFGRQCIVVAIDAKCSEDGKGWEVYTHGGRSATGLSAVNWARELEERGAGEILLTSMDRDGSQDGYDLELTAAVSEAVNIPVIASGGAGSLEHFWLVLTRGKSEAALAASVFHSQTFTIMQVKEYLAAKGVEVRLP